MLRTSVSFFLVSHGRHDTESSHACQLNTKNRADRTVFPSPVANGLSSEPSTNGGSALLLVLPLCGCMLVRKRPIPLSALSTRRRHRYSQHSWRALGPLLVRDGWLGTMPQRLRWFQRFVGVWGHSCH